MTTLLTFIHALSPLHAGTGQGIGVIDLPIAREKATNLPFLPGSSLKGPLRALCPQDKRSRIFGPETIEITPGSDYASSIQFSDQRLLLLPIRSLTGTFAWVTSPYVLHRLLRDILDTGTKHPGLDIPDIQKVEGCFVATENSKVKDSTNKVYLEDLDLQASVNQKLSDWAIWMGQQIFPDEKDWQQMFLERICLIHDDIFSFLADTATEVSARIRLKEDSKTVQDGGLWYEEALPTETILYGLIMATPIKATVDEVFNVINEATSKAIQLGGKATVGKGLCRIRVGKA